MKSVISQTVSALSNICQSVVLFGDKFEGFVPIYSEQNDTISFIFHGVYK